MTADRLPGAARRAVRNRGGPAGYFFRPPPLDFRFVLRPPRVFVSPARARCLLTVRAAISSARGLPRFSSDSLMCSYWRLRLELLTPRGGMVPSFAR